MRESMNRGPLFISRQLFLPPFYYPLISLAIDVAVAAAIPALFTPATPFGTVTLNSGRADGERRFIKGLSIASNVPRPTSRAP